MIKKLSSCVGKYKKYALLCPLFVALEVIFEILIPYIMKFILARIEFVKDAGQTIDDVKYVALLGVIMIVLAIVSLICGALAGRFAAIASMGFARNIREKEFRKIQDFSYGNIDKYPTSSLITRLTTDVTNLQNSFMIIIRTLVRSPLMLVGALTMAIILNAKLSLVFLVAIIVLGLSFTLIVTFAYPSFSKLFKKYDKLNESLQENLIAAREVKAFVREDYESNKFEYASNEIKQYSIRAERIVILNAPAMNLVMYGSLLAIYWFGGRMVIQNVPGFNAEDLITFASYVTQILMSLMMLSMSFVQLVMSRAAATRIIEIFDELPEINDYSASSSIEPADGSITFRNVNFSYSKNPENLTLEHININIPSGSTIGIIGGTGSSKTTLVHLIPRLYDVLDGEVVVGGHNVKEYKLTTLRDSVAMVLQKNVLFSGTIKDNLRWGDANVSEEEMKAACKAACCDEFISSFPDGYDTMISQGGVNVSGGQKQRLCIARALIKKPKIIILDDSTSAVDTKTDSIIRTGLKQKLVNMTTIIIAQRISSIIDADQIIVMNEGKINAIGTHDELLKTNEIYRDVYQSQMKGSES